MSTTARAIICLLACAVPAIAFGIDADERLADPEQAALYERLVDEVRCLVCQNQTIGDSSAPLAADLRREIREQVAAGRTEAEIKTFLTDRYGDFVLYRPRFAGPALILWLAPGILLAGGAWIFVRSLRRRAKLPVPEEGGSPGETSTQ